MRDKLQQPEGSARRRLSPAVLLLGTVLVLGGCTSDDDAGNENGEGTAEPGIDDDIGGEVRNDEDSAAPDDGWTAFCETAAARPRLDERLTEGGDEPSLQLDDGYLTYLEDLRDTAPDELDEHMDTLLDSADPPDAPVELAGTSTEVFFHALTGGDRDTHEPAWLAIQWVESLSQDHCGDDVFVVFGVADIAEQVEAAASYPRRDEDTVIVAPPLAGNEPLCEDDAAAVFFDDEIAERFVAASDDYLLAACGDLLFAIDLEEPALAWTQRFGDEIRGVHGGGVVTVTWQEHTPPEGLEEATDMVAVTAIDAATGDEHWTIDIVGPDGPLDDENAYGPPDATHVHGVTSDGVALLRYPEVDARAHPLHTFGANDLLAVDTDGEPSWIRDGWVTEQNFQGHVEVGTTGHLVAHERGLSPDYEIVDAATGDTVTEIPERDSDGAYWGRCSNFAAFHGYGYDAGTGTVFEFPAGGDEGRGVPTGTTAYGVIFTYEGTMAAADADGEVWQMDRAGVAERDIVDDELIAANEAGERFVVDGAGELDPTDIDVDDLPHHVTDGWSMRADWEEGLLRFQPLGDC